ncbi:MAG: substrate-binding domain-containing protein, partial [Alphaproteobacteria bacterium]|nr:substrate-binding domain-containing protein [Alphaproteobacteria bacterium]
EAGVSTGTVSRALSDGSLVNQATRERIRIIAEAHNYAPNLFARNLRTRKAGAIAVVIPLGHEREQHLSDPFFAMMLGYLADELAKRGDDLLLSRVIPSNSNWLGRYINSGRIDGIIVIGQSNQSDALDKASDHYMPLVVWGARRPHQRYCTVGSDNRLGGLLATVHLFEHGCKSLAFIGDPTPPEIEQRLEGCRAGCIAVGMSADVQVIPAHLTADLAYAAVMEFLAKGNIPDGFVAASDVIAMAALRAFGEYGIAVPGRVKITGYDDLGFASHTSPPLTSVQQDLEQSAAHLVDLVYRRAAGEATESVVLAPKLVARESTGVPE